MNYLSSIYRQYFLIACGLLMVHFSFAQQNTISPYSRFGLGELHNQEPLMAAGISGANVSMAPLFNVNFTNPASYSSLIRPVFQVGLTGRSLFQENETTTEQYSITRLTEISVGLPLSKRLGAAFGIMPYSSVGYNLREAAEVLPDGSTAEYRYTGDGGYTRGYLGFSGKHAIVKDKLVSTSKGILVDTVKYIDTEFSLGLNGNVIFGRTDYTRDVVFSNTAAYHRAENNSLLLRGTSLTLGALIKKNLNTAYEYRRGESVKTNSIDLTLGASYSLENGLGFTAEQLIQNATYNATVDALSPQDTIFYSGEVEGDLRLPAELRVGATFSFQNEKERKVELAVQYKSQNWNGFSGAFDDGVSPDRYTNSSILSVGLQLTPKPIDEPNTKWYETTIYQLGFSNGTSYLSFSDEILPIQRISAGLSIPFLGSNSFSRLNLGMDFGTWGTTTNGLIKETSYNGYIGISIMPHRNDRWFVKSKYR